jgi:hypothetical protein
VSIWPPNQQKIKMGADEIIGMNQNKKPEKKFRPFNT